MKRLSRLQALVLYPAMTIVKKRTMIGHGKIGNRYE